jgi:Reverse transcriptase (RNA-dependent DNA polymerase)
MHFKLKIWNKIVIKDIPYGRMLIGSRRVFKCKKNGIYRACLCALGYNQVPGLDYTNNFAPVVNNITVNLVLLCWLANRAWEARVYDGETAFLFGDLEDLVYIRTQKGLNFFVQKSQFKT